MPCKREARKRHNTIAFWLSDEEKAVVEARIILSGLQKGQYYRAAILGEEVKVIAGNYLSNRVAIAIEKLSLAVMEQDTEESRLLIALLRELLEVMHNKNAPADGKDISLP
ncbi:MAG: hypothetical protein J6Y89_05805 [Lachnospiraceae bacterium]|nr:hypothetical protein [Lachnospiraceae bacterium]